VCDWRLNERHYGALQGLNKADTAAQYGEDRVYAWRRGFEDEPPALPWEDARHPHFDPRYTHLPPESLPPGVLQAGRPPRPTGLHGRPDRALRRAKKLRQSKGKRRFFTLCNTFLGCVY